MRENVPRTQRVTHAITVKGRRQSSLYYIVCRVALGAEPLIIVPPTKFSGFCVNVSAFLFLHVGSVDVAS